MQDQKGHIDQRVLHRDISPGLLYPVSCVLRFAGSEIEAEVVNYHFGGACLTVANPTPLQREVLKTGEGKLDFYLGETCLQRDMPYRISWQDDQEKFTFGVAFQNRIGGGISRAERFVVNQNAPIQVVASDPMDPHRLVMFQVVDVSESGMLLRSSMTNKHLLPGMKLKKATITVPTQSPIELELGVENTRKGSSPNSFLLGVAVRAEKERYIEAIRGYLSQVAPVDNDLEGYFKRMRKSRLWSKSMRSAVTYRIVSTESQYEQVLKLRFQGYGKHAKVAKGSTWQQQGEGLANEGTIIAGYMGAHLVSSMELRFGSDALPLRVQKMLPSEKLVGIDLKRVVELNKLVVHPDAQGSDLVLGMLQKAHAIVMTKGQLDVLGVATDQLKILYERVGAVSLGVRFPHPTLPEQHLNLMLVKRETYHDGMRLNPYVWSVVYKSVHDHMSGMGSARGRRFSIGEHVKIKLGSIVQKIIARRKKISKTNNESAQSEQAQAKSSQESIGFIDPKWTRQDILATIMRPYIREAALMAGSESVERILQKLAIPMSYFENQSNWLSIAFHDAFLDEFSTIGDAMELSRRAGRRSMQRDMLGVNYFVMKHFMTPEMAYNSFSKLMPRFNRTRTYDVVKLGPRRLKIMLGLVSPTLLPARRESCANWQTSFEAYIPLMTGRPGQVKKTACCYEGATHCAYEVAWDFVGSKSTSLLWSILPILGGLISGYAVPRQDSTIMFYASISGAALGATLAAVYSAFMQRRETNASYKDFLNFQAEASERYSDLQQAKKRADEAYHEARLLEGTMREIQKTNDVGSLLQTALDAACKRFGFDRGFAMLLEEKIPHLRTAAVAGVSDDAGLLWRYSVDVSAARENPMLLSSVYLSGNSVLIDRIESHLFQLNEDSQKLVSQFGSKGFVIVAIPGRDRCWGVVVVDKKTSDRRFTRRDSVVLERLSQQIGIALDKRMDLERERALRTTFQKYAPSALLHSAKEGSDSVSSEAGMRRVGVMFIDIRGFTKMSQALPPRTTVQLLNGLFAAIEPVISKSSGVVDKYLGDGALVMWGSVGRSEPDASKIIASCGEILEAVKRYNQTLKTRGLPAINVGIGVHIGDALVGNVGSAERLEYTAIGPTINLASRLEQLCKNFSCTIVASEDLVLAAGTADSAGWRRVNDVAVRGVDNKISVYVFGERQQPISINTSYLGVAS